MELHETKITLLLPLESIQASYTFLLRLWEFFVSEQSITHAYQEIASCKTELQQAKRIRRNRQGSKPSKLALTRNLETGQKKATLHL